MLPPVGLLDVHDAGDGQPALCVHAGHAAERPASLPTTVRATITSRVDNMAPSARLSLKVESVSGMRAPLAAVEHVHPLHIDSRALAAERVPVTGTVRTTLSVAPEARVPCNNDLLAANIIDDGTRLWLIDYEYSGNNDPMWDLGDLSVEGEFGPEQDAVLLRAYFGGEPPADEVGRMIAYKAMCDLLWTLWGVIQHVNGNPAEDFKIVNENFDQIVALNMAQNGFIAGISSQRPYDQGVAEAKTGALALIGEETPSYIVVPPLKVVRGNLPDSYKTIYRIDLPEEMATALAQ